MLPARAHRRTIAAMDRIGPYDVLELVGRGGIGRVYRALHRDTGAEVALKLLHPSHRGDALVRRLVINEAIAAGRLSHANVVALVDGGLDESGAPFLVTELVRGPQLTAWIARWPGLAPVARVIDGLLAGLGEAHANGIVHRDLKPENVLVDARDPGSLVAKIADFGIARLLDPVDEGPAPHGAGTRAYMAPEQIAPDMPSGPWTDLYAVGAILKELLSGAAGKGPLRGRPGLELPRGLVKLVAALTSAEPHARPRFASAVRSDLADLLARIRERDLVRVEAVEPMRVGSPTVEIEARESDVAALVPRPAITSLPVWRLRDPPLVGREKEREIVIALARRISARGGSRVLVLRGPPGIGKSRIARLGLATVERAALMESLSTGYDADADDTAGGLRREIARMIGVPSLALDGSIPQRWRWLARLDPSLDLATLARWLRGGTTDPPVDRLAAVVHSLLVAMSRVRPIYLWLDDVVWARDGAWELVERIASRPTDGAILAVATVRTPLERVSVERSRDLRALLRTRTVVSRSVGPLSLRHARDLAARTARDRGSVADDAAIRQSGGRPLAVVERAISPDGSFVARRIDELVACLGDGAGDALRVLSAAAILGGRFEDRVLRTAMGALDRVLDLALLGGLLRVERASTYRFEHAVYRDELLDRLASRSDEAALHLAVARAMVSVYGDERADIAGRSAILLRRGGDRPAAWHWLLHAATMNARAGDREAAGARLELADRWLRADRVPRDDERRARVLYTRANALYFESAYPRALSGVRRAAKMAGRLGLDDLAADCRALEANVCFYMGAHDDSERLARACAAYVGRHELGREVLGFIVHHRLGELAQVRGDLEASKRALEESRRFAAATQTTWRIGISAVNLADLELARGDVQAAQERVAELRQLAPTIADDSLLGEITDVCARVEIFSGNAADARVLLEPRAKQLETLGDAWRLSSLRVLEALASVELDSPAAVGRAVGALLRAFAVTTIDDAFSERALARLARRLEERGLEAPLRRVRRLAAERDRWRGRS